ncbi:hypothetical protein GCM10023176_44850 [Micromonospora coerulea]|uniref:Uncharacterized protein n=1 Tax=Micromonospora coerulea TaxID=47856 RepID=A0ABP8SVC7_9ACTN
MHPCPGDLLVIDGRASVQFAGDRALTFRVVSVCDRPTYAGWVWLTGYVINRRGQATAKREVYVQLAGLTRANDTGRQRIPGQPQKMPVGSRSTTSSRTVTLAEGGARS